MFIARYASLALLTVVVVGSLYHLAQIAATTAMNAIPAGNCKAQTLQSLSPSSAPSAKTTKLQSSMPQTSITPCSTVADSSLVPSQIQLERWFADITRHVREAQDLMSVMPNATDCVIIDVGANVGAFSLAMLRNTSCRVIGFEAVPWYAEFAQQKIRQNGYGARYSMHIAALTDRDGTSEILVSQDANKGWNSLIHEKRWGAMVPLCVPTMRFASWLSISHALLPAITAIKIDTEGAEGLVLNGMRDVLSGLSVKPALLIEIAWPGNHPLWQVTVDELEYLFGIGYARFDYEGLRRTQNCLITTQKSMALT